MSSLWERIINRETLHRIITSVSLTVAIAANLSEFHSNFTATSKPVLVFGGLEVSKKSDYSLHKIPTIYLDSQPSTTPKLDSTLND